MNELKSLISNIILNDRIYKIIISNPINKSIEFKKIVIESKSESFHISKYTEKQVFHENVLNNELAERVFNLTDRSYKQINAWSKSTEHIILISKKGTFNYKKTPATLQRNEDKSHNRKKNYILEEGKIIAPLIDMGIFTADGKIVNSMYSKYKQINRFLEMIDDEISNKRIKSLNVIDFGCGKSYLTFILYYYLTEIKQIDVNMIGLDLKSDVIEKCNKASIKYGYSTLHFELGDINGYKTPFDVDMVVTLHACNTATDFALYNAIQWNAKYIFSVPCCQHEFNEQMKPENFTILSRYGIIQERFSALATDAIRANLLEYSGYKTQLLEFIDIEHTPKNVLIRAVKRASTKNEIRSRALAEINTLINEFGVSQTLYQLLIKY